MIGREDEIKLYRDRVSRFSYVVLGAILVLMGRVFYLQIVIGDTLRKYSEENRLKKEKLFPNRGVVYDRNGKVIVDSRASFDVVLLPQYYPFEKGTNQRLANALGMSLEGVERKLSRAKKRASFYSVLLKADVGKETIAAIEMDTLGFPGVDVEASVHRRFPYGDLAAQVLGYVGEVTQRDIKRDPRKQLQAGDYIGKMGLERKYDRYLRGVDGVGYVEVDARGRRRKREKGEDLLGFTTRREPISGHDLHLSIDIELQKVALRAMRERGYIGSVVALDPRNGEVLAMLSEPAYHPEVLSGREVNAEVWKALREDKSRPLRNRAIQDHFPPGSTFKLFPAIAGLQEGLTATKDKVKCKGFIKFGNRKFHCWKRHGEVDFLKAIKESCDVYFYRLGEKLGVDKIAEYARHFGLGSKLGFQLSGEQSGLIPDSAWKLKNYKERWHAGETLSVVIGQGFVLATPLQMASAFAALGNGGFVYRPFLVKQIQARTGQVIEQFRPILNRKIEIASEAFDRAREGLWQVVNEKGGTAYWKGRSKVVEISGKTGTAQVRRFKQIMETKCEKMEFKDRHHGWFVGYAPPKDPEIAVAAIGEHACHGSSLSPVVKEVIEAYYHQKEAVEKERDLAVGGKEAR